MKYNYYYNNVPEKGFCRNNLIYTSLISEDKKTFVQWYHNDTEYHKGHNQVVDPLLMEEKWQREVKFLRLMSENYPIHVPEIIDIDEKERKVYLKIEGPDMWEMNNCSGNDYSNVLSDWSSQMLEIIQAHKNLGIYKYSMHPSSYFVVNGKLKSINYFFCYSDQDKPITLRSVVSHISEERLSKLIPILESSNIKIDEPTPFKDLQILTFETFKSNFQNNVMESAKKIYA